MKNYLITVENRGYIPALQLEGPVVNPILVSEKICRKLVSSNYNVFIHNPNEPKKLVNIEYLIDEAKNKTTIVEVPEPVKPFGDDVEIVSIPEEVTGEIIEEVPVVSETEEEPVEESDETAEVKKPLTKAERKKLRAQQAQDITEAPKE